MAKFASCEGRRDEGRHAQAARALRCASRETAPELERLLPDWQTERNRLPNE